MVSSYYIKEAIGNTLGTINMPGLGKFQGKVRDIYKIDDKRLTVTTDRQSAFDQILGEIPFKGAVLNQLAAFWFEQTKHIVDNHMISVPDPNVLLSYEVEPIPVEIIVRGYMTGVTNTSIWYSYQRGDRNIYGIDFPDGLVKNDKLPNPVITPTTHAEKGQHDVRLTRDEIISKGIVEEGLYKEVEEAALGLFDFGSRLCEERGLILVDTKYEFGLLDGKLMLMDEIHTPDSSRFWIADTYASRHKNGEEPENFDKEFLRLWYADKGYTGDGDPPPMSEELVVALSKRYMQVFEKITGTVFKQFDYPAERRIIENCEEIGE